MSTQNECGQNGLLKLTFIFEQNYIFSGFVFQKW